jgi:Uri superfamily endonuclease
MIGRIYCLRLPGGKFYIGSTIQDLHKRLNHHRKSGKVRTSILYSYIHNNGGWDFVTIECLEEIEVPTRKDLLILEDTYLRLLKNDDCLNSNNVFRTEEEFCEERLKNSRRQNLIHRQKRNEQQRMYRLRKSKANIETNGSIRPADRGKGTEGEET